MAADYTFFDGKSRVEFSSADAPGFADSLAESFARCDGVLRLAIPMGFPTDLERKSVRFLEIRFEDAQRCTMVELAGREETYDRLLVPLSGELSGGMTTFFHGEGSYRNGPYSSRSGSAEILDELERLQVVRD